MGNCIWGVMSDPETVIKVIKSNGGIMEFYPPITVNSITNEFQGHAIFSSHDTFSKPLCQFEELVAGQSYYLLPLGNKADYPSVSSTVANTNSNAGHSNTGHIVRQGHVSSTAAETNIDTRHRDTRQIVRQGHVRSRSVPMKPKPAPYRTSLDYRYYQGVGLLKRNTTESFSCRRKSNTSNNISGNYSNNHASIGFWKVKLVITPEKLLDILSQEACTKELIESVRIVAKCGVAAVAGGGCGGGGGISSATSIVSDQWSFSSSGRSAPSKIDSLVVDI